MDYTNAEFGKRLGRYSMLVKKLNDTQYPEHLHEVEIVSGNRYFKVMVTTEMYGTTRSHLHTFVDSSNGNILKAASYKAPAKNGVRGSIFAKDLGESVINWYGARYLK